MSQWPIWLVSGASRTVAAHGHLGVLITPANWRRTRPLGRVWAMDNGAFSGFDEAAYLRMLAQFPVDDLCKFVVVPDVVGDAVQTRQLWDAWVARLDGWPLAYVLQDGEDGTTVPWEQIAAVFVGGTTDYKLSRTAADIVLEAHERGVWTHMGRVNSRRRYRYAHDLHIDSVDGSRASRFPDDHCEDGKRWTRQARLWGGRQQHSSDVRFSGGRP